MKDWKIPDLESVQISSNTPKSLVQLDGNQIFSNFTATFNFRNSDGNWAAEFLIRVSKYETPTLATVSIQGFRSSSFNSKSSQEYAVKKLNELKRMGLTKEEALRALNQVVVHQNVTRKQLKTIEQFRALLFNIALQEAVIKSANGNRLANQIRAGAIDRKTRKVITREFLELVAFQYSQAIKNDEFPIKTLQFIHNCSERTAQEWVTAARREKILPPTTQGIARGSKTNSSPKKQSRTKGR